MGKINLAIPSNYITFSVDEAGVIKQLLQPIDQTLHLFCLPIAPSEEQEVRDPTGQWLIKYRFSVLPFPTKAGRDLLGDKFDSWNLGSALEKAQATVRKSIVSWALNNKCVGGSGVHGTGQTRFKVMRGDFQVMVAWTTKSIANKK